MNIKTDKKLIHAALESGCTTAAQLAHFLRIHALIARAYHSA